MRGNVMRTYNRPDDETIEQDYVMYLTPCGQDY